MLVRKIIPKGAAVENADNETLDVGEFLSIQVHDGLDYWQVYKVTKVEGNYANVRSTFPTKFFKTEAACERAVRDL